MPAYLAYSYCTGLSKNEEIAIDKQVCRNREKVFIFAKNLPSNTKRKLKRVIVVMFTFAISQPLAPCAAVMLPPPTSISRLQCIDKSRIKTNKNCPRTAPVIGPRVDKVILTDKRIGYCKFKNGSITMEEAILQLRGGDGLIDIAAVIAFIIFVNWYDSLFGVDAAFQPKPLPHMDRLGWFISKYDCKGHPNQQSMAIPPSRFERDTLHTMKQMCAVSADENGFVMDYDVAYILIKETYSGSMQITEDFQISDWQALKHIYHGTGVGINPEDYGIPQQELELMRQEPGGLIAYVQRGHKLPSLEHVKAYQKALKDICKNPSTLRRDDSKYYYKHGVTPATVFYNQDDRYIIVFNQTNGDLITGNKQRPLAIRKFVEKNTLGSRQWIAKWSK